MLESVKLLLLLNLASKQAHLSQTDTQCAASSRVKSAPLITRLTIVPTHSGCMVPYSGAAQRSAAAYPEEHTRHDNTKISLQLHLQLEKLLCSSSRANTTLHVFATPVAYSVLHRKCYTQQAAGIFCRYEQQAD